MALRNPPSWLQNGSHPAENDRLTTQATVGIGGVAGSVTAFQVTAQASPNMTVKVAAGWAAVPGSGGLGVGQYMVYNDASVNASIATADPSNPRIDLVCLTIQDAAYSGSSNQAIIQVVAGTPAVSPTTPSTPSNAIALATIQVNAATTTITSGNISDIRVYAATTLAIEPIAGNNLNAPMTLTSGTLVTSGTIGGSIEYDGKTFYAAPTSGATPTAAGGRAVIPQTHIHALSADRTLTTTTNEAAFGLSLASAANTTYEVEAVMYVSIQATGGAASFAAGLGGTFGLTSTSYKIEYSATATGFSTSAALNSYSVTTVGGSPATIFSSVSAGVPYYARILIKGLVRVSSNGAIRVISTLTGTGTPSGTLYANSYFKITPIGSNTMTIVGAWS